MAIGLLRPRESAVENCIGPGASCLLSTLSYQRPQERRNRKSRAAG